VEHRLFRVNLALWGKPHEMVRRTFAVDVGVYNWARLAAHVVHGCGYGSCTNSIGIARCPTWWWASLVERTRWGSEVGIWR
jgi:hypothetical protein